MGKLCVVAECDSRESSNISLFKFPFHNKALLKKWVNFVNMKRSGWSGPTIYSRICVFHFTPDAFDDGSINKFRFGISARPKLKEKAFPTIHNAVQSEKISSKKRGRSSIIKREINIASNKVKGKGNIKVLTQVFGTSVDQLVVNWP